MSEEVYIHRINNPYDNHSYPFQSCYDLNKYTAYVENVKGSLERCVVIPNEDSPFMGKVITPAFATNPEYLKVIIKLN